MRRPAPATILGLLAAWAWAGAAGSPLLPQLRPPPQRWASRPHVPIPPGTDRGLYNEGLFEGDIVTPPALRNAVSDENLLWPEGTIVFKTENDVGCPESPQCQILMQAMDEYHQKTCIRFKEWTGEKDYVRIFFNSDSGACWSPVGRSGDGEQLLSLGRRCWYLGIVVHELGHAVGFWHEMNRPDRDSWIRVFWDNIIQGFAHAFEKHDPATVDTLGEQFDYRSIMMYDEYAFAKDLRSPTIQPLQPGVVIGPIWQKTGLSDIDVRRIHKLYKCYGNRPLRGFPRDVTCDFQSNACGFYNGGAAVWLWQNSSYNEGYVYSSCERSGSTPGYFMSANMHAVPWSAGKQGCVRFWYILRSDAHLVLQLTQIQLNKVTQLHYDPEMTVDLWESRRTANKWHHVEIPIDISRPFKILFTSAYSDACRQGTIALDDVVISYSPCPASSTAPPDPTTHTPTTTCATVDEADSSTWTTEGATETVTEEPHLPPRPAITQPPPTSTTTTTTTAATTTTSETTTTPETTATTDQPDLPTSATADSNATPDPFHLAVTIFPTNFLGNITNNEI